MPSVAHATTTTTTSTTTTATTPPFSFDGSVPPPQILNVGTDYVAIARSLLGYVSWLKLHDPDVSLLSEVYVKGTDLTRRFSRDLEILAANTLRFVDVNQRLEVDVVTVDGDLVTLKVLEHITAERLVDSTGAVVDEKPSGPLNEYVVVMTSDARGRWKLAEISRRAAETQVRL